MLTVWRKAGQYDPRRASAAAWIFAIARNLRIDAQRRSQLALPPPDPSDDLAPVPPADAVIAAEQRGQRLRAALDRLPRATGAAAAHLFRGAQPERDRGAARRTARHCEIPPAPRHGQIARGPPGGRRMIRHHPSDLSLLRCCAATLPAPHAAVGGGACGALPGLRHGAARRRGDRRIAARFGADRGAGTGRVAAHARRARPAGRRPADPCTARPGGDGDALALGGPGHFDDPADPPRLQQQPARSHPRGPRHRPAGAWPWRIGDDLRARRRLRRWQRRLSMPATSSRPSRRTPTGRPPCPARTASA